MTPERITEEEEWTELIKQLIAAGVRIGWWHDLDNYHWRSCIISFPTTDVELSITFYNKIRSSFYTRHGNSPSTFNNCFDKLPQQYKDVLIFHLNLLEPSNGV